MSNFQLALLKEETSQLLKQEKCAQNVENPLLNESLQEETTLSLVPDFQNVITLRQKKKSQLFSKKKTTLRIVQNVMVIW